MSRVCVVLNSNWNVINFRLGLLKNLQKNGCEIHIVTPNDEYTQVVLSHGFIHHDWNMKPYSVNVFFEMLVLIRLCWLIFKIKPEYCLSFTIKPNLYASIACTLFSVKQVANIAGLGRMYARNGIFPKLVRWFYQLCLNGAFWIFFQNSEDQRKFLQTKKVLKTRTSVLPGSGVQVPDEKAPYHSSGKIVFLMFCRLLKSKGIYEYAAAAKRIRSQFQNVEFQLLGFLDHTDPDSVCEKDLVYWQSQGIINYLGYTRDVKEFVLKADCVILPSYYPEGTPRALLEAGSLARPIITTDWPGCKDTAIHGTSGYLVKARSIEDLEMAIRKFIGLSVEKRMKMSTASFRHISENFDEKIIFQKYRKVVLEDLQ